MINIDILTVLITGRLLNTCSINQVKTYEFLISIIRKQVIDKRISNAYHGTYPLQVIDNYFDEYEIYHFIHLTKLHLD